jgi:hypothetical protein
MCVRPAPAGFVEQRAQAALKTRHAPADSLKAMEDLQRGLAVERLLAGTQHGNAAAELFDFVFELHVHRASIEHMFEWRKSWEGSGRSVVSAAMRRTSCMSLECELDQAVDELWVIDA